MQLMYTDYQDCLHRDIHVLTSGRGGWGGKQKEKLANHTTFPTLVYGIAPLVTYCCTDFDMIRVGNTELHSTAGLPNFPPLSHSFIEDVPRNIRHAYHQGRPAASRYSVH